MVFYDAAEDVPERYREPVAEELGDETFLCGTRVADGLLPRTWPRLILTPTRLVFIRNGITRSETKSYPYDTISTTGTDDTGAPRLHVTTNDGSETVFALEVDGGSEFARRLTAQVTPTDTQ